MDSPSEILSFVLSTPLRLVEEEWCGWFRLEGTSKPSDCNPCHTSHLTRGHPAWPWGSAAMGQSQSPCSDSLLHRGQNIYPQKKRTGGDGAAEPRHGSSSAFSSPAVCLCMAFCGSHQCTDKHLIFSTCKLHQTKIWKGKHFCQGSLLCFLPFVCSGTMAKEKGGGGEKTVQLNNAALRGTVCDI